MRKDLTIAGSWTAHLLRGFEGVGLDGRVLCREAGVSYALLSNPDARVPRDASGLLWKAAAHRTLDRDLGLHVAEATPLVLNNLLAHVSISAASLWDMLTQYLHLQRLVAHGPIASLAVDGDHATLALARIGGDLKVTRHEIEYMAAYLLRFWRHFLDADLHPLRVLFQHPCPRERSEHERVFGCPVDFAQAVDGFVFSTAALQRPLPHFSEGTFHRLRVEAEAALANVSDPSCSGEVSTLLRLRLPSGSVDLESIARSLHMSMRTLQRRLEHEGTSFHAVLDSVRRDVAFEEIRGGKDLRTAARAAGFTDGPSFWRAFKRWTGGTPHMFRQQAAGAQDPPAPTPARAATDRPAGRCNALAGIEPKRSGRSRRPARAIDRPWR